MGMRAEKFILASSSPRRKDLLKSLGFEFDVIPASVDESMRKSESPMEHSYRLAREKARNVAKRYPEKWVIAADTIVIIDGKILGKPKSEAEAFEMFKRISGRVHTVITAFCILKQEGPTYENHAESKVKIAHLADEEIRWYISTGEPLDKAGAYGAQGIGAMFIKKINGSYTNVVGLPLAELIEGMKKLKLVRFEK